jgi:hypothetical protein
MLVHAPLSGVRDLASIPFHRAPGLTSVEPKRDPLYRSAPPAPITPPVPGSDAARDARPRQQGGSDGVVAVWEARELDSAVVADFAVH